MTRPYRAKSNYPTNRNLANCFKPVTAASVYSFTAPVMMPLTKYFWMKG